MSGIGKKTYLTISGSGSILFFRKTRQTIYFLVFALISSAFCWKFGGKSTTPDSLAKSTPVETGKKSGIAGIFFDEQYAQHGFTYAYPKTSSVGITKKVVKNGRVSLQLDLAVDSFSGGSVCLLDRQYNVRPYIKKGAVQFWIKGATGAEKAWVALVDEAATDSQKTVVRVDIDWFGKIGTEWSFISIPLEHFGEQGVYWDETEQRETQAPFDWNRVAEFRIESRKDENATFRVWIDDIVIVKSLR